MTKFSLCFYGILVIFLIGCSQNASTPFSTNGVLNGSTSKFEGNVSDPSSIAFFKTNVGDRVLFPIDQSDLDQSGKDILLDQVGWLQREFLVSRGIESSRIQTVSFGKERPVELCSNENCYRENRRAVSVVSNLNF